jgi:ABC-type multidrug transport system fused ATPase/permease subunit
LHEDGSNGRETEIGFDRATFSWGPKDEDLGQENPAFRLISMDIRFKVGALNIIAGPSGSGKTSLLMALLGEMTLIDGQVHLPGGQSREDLKADPQTGLIDSVAYCAQQAWLVNDTIQQNIIFASPWDERRYNSVLEACALKKDIEILADGDATLVGEKGIVVSGGQKQRISLARALYSNARHVLLDDCLSAVDSHTAQHIFEHCVLGPLMLNRTCILVTHNVGLCVPRSQFVVVLANGKISSQGEPEKIMQSGALGEELSMSRSATEVHSRLQSIHDVKTADPRGNNEPTAGSTESTEELSTTSKAQAGENANRRTEEKAVGAVSWKVMRLYLTSMGPWYFWFLVLFFFAAENIAGVWTNVWVRAFANSYLHRSASISGISARSQATNHLPAVTNGYRPDLSWTGPALWRHFPLALDQEFSIQNANVNAGYYLSIFAVLALLFLSIVTARNAVLFTGSLNASRAIHAGLLNSVMRAKFKFFDSTPLGQIMNRFSKDLQAIDQDVAPTAAGCLQGIFAMVAIIVLISVITPGFIIAMIFLSVIYAAIGLFYVQCSRDLKRLESVQRSPVYQLFGETLSGITTIRAYGDSRRFARENFHRVDTHNRPFIYLWSANRWLALRVDFAGALVSFFAGALVVAGARTLDAGAAGLSMTYALMFNENILWLVRLYADNEQNMNHVERVKTFLDVEQEADALIPATQPAGNWPDKGAVEFVDYSTRYRADLEPVLKNLNVKFHGEEKVGIVGRTGAGKSSLALALFRGLEADQGKILIDGVDIGTIGLQTLRENITIVPQDPTLFTGTIRNNLDPFGLFTDEEIFTALRRVHLIGSSPGSSTPASVPAEPVNTLIAPTRPDDTDPAADLANVVTNIRENANIFLTLSSPITESGSNLSQGQRQLLCLARAILKQPRVLLMDEATASIDYATDARIQETLRQIAGSTIITIAHRLQTIVDYDKVLVLDRGEIVEYDAPWVLIRKTGGVFRGMCEMSGDLEGLLEAAGKAEKARMLIEV